MTKRDDDDKRKFVDANDMAVTMGILAWNPHVVRVDLDRKERSNGCDDFVVVVVVCRFRRRSCGSSSSSFSSPRVCYRFSRFFRRMFVVISSTSSSSSLFLFSYFERARRRSISARLGRRARGQVDARPRPRFSPPLAEPNRRRPEEDRRSSSSSSSSSSSRF